MIDFTALNDKVVKERSRQYAKNAAENYQKIKADFQKADYSIDTLPRFTHEMGIPAIILGSGPSLDDVLPELKKGFNGVIFSSPSQLDIMEKWEIRPNYIVAVDAADDVGTLQIREGRDTYGMTLLTNPYISPEVLKVWTGNRRYFNLDADDPHFEDVFPWITQRFPLAGSVNNTQCLIANWMGFNPIVLAGVDYCFPGGRTRAQDYRKRGPYIFDPKPSEMVQVKEGQTSASQETLFYANILLGLWKMTKMPLIQIGNKGALTEIPFIQSSDIHAPVQARPLDDAKIAEIDEAMISYGMYAEVTVDGVGHFRYAEKDQRDYEAAQTALVETEKRDYAWYKNLDGSWGLAKE